MVTVIPEKLFIIQMKSGAFWIGKVASGITDGRIIVEGPRMLVPRNDDGKRIVFVVARAIGNPKELEVVVSNIEVMYNIGDEALANHYIEEVTGIRLSKAMPAAPFKS